MVRKSGVVGGAEFENRWVSVEEEFQRMSTSTMPTSIAKILAFARAIAIVAAGMVVHAVQAPASATIGSTVVVAEDARLDAVAGFTLVQWQEVNNCFGNAVLVAPDRVILPRHLINSTFTARNSIDGLATDYVVRFRRRPDGGVGTASDPATFHHVRVARWVFHKDRKATDDVVIGILETPVTHITPMVVNFDAKLNRGRLAATVSSWGPDEAGIKGTLRSGGIVLSKLTSTLAQWREGVQAILHDSGAAITVTQRDGSQRLVGFVTTSGGGVSVKKWKNSVIFPKPRRR